MAEEVKNPRRNLPIAILLALVISTLLYMLVAVVCVLTVPVEVLATSDAPLAAVIEAAGLSANISIGPIGMVAVVNGALIQIVMAARVLYGMGGNGLAARVAGDRAPLYTHAIARHSSGHDRRAGSGPDVSPGASRAGDQFRYTDRICRREPGFATTQAARATRRRYRQLPALGAADRRRTVRGFVAAAILRVPLISRGQLCPAGPRGFDREGNG